MSNLVQWSLLVSMVVPFIVATVNRERWSPRVKVFIFVVISVIVSAGTCYFQGDFTGKRWLDSTLIVLVAAGSFYRTLKPTKAVDYVEQKTG